MLRTLRDINGLAILQTARSPSAQQLLRNLSHFHMGDDSLAV
jgi:hypothetical protein